MLGTGRVQLIKSMELGYKRIQFQVTGFKGKEFH